MESIYKETWDNIEFSFSTLHLYKQCPYAVYLKKVCSEKGISNPYADIGSYGHLLNENIFKNEMSVQEALNDCVENFDNNIYSYISDSTKDKKYIELCDYLSEFDESFWDEYEVIGVEQEFHWQIEKYKCVGYADLIFRNKKTNKVYLIDHKSASHFMKKDGTPLKNQLSNFLAYRHQMYMYADGMMKKYGFKPDYIVWNHFLDGSSITKIPFNEDDYKETLNWVVDTIESIYADETFEAKEDFMLCNKLCDYRDGICEYKELRREEDE